MEADRDIISRLRYQLKEAEEEKRKAAQCGLQLLKSENLLQNRLDELQNEMVTKAENFEQAKYTHQREVELKNRMLESLNLEYEALKQQQNVQLDELRRKLETLHGQEIKELKNKVEKLKPELDEALLSEKQLKHKVDNLKDVIASKSKELCMSERVQESMSSEILSLQHEVLSLEKEKRDFEDHIHELQYNKEQLELANSNLTNRLARLEEEKEGKEKDLVSLCNSLEETREMNRGLQVQLDHALQQTQDFPSQGNSLFAEVEDRRIETERNLISMKVKYQSLQKEYNFTREQLQRVELQIAEDLLRMKGSQGEHDQLDRLPNMLQQKNGEIEELLMEVKQLEKPMKVSENSRELKQCNASEDEAFEHDNYVDLLPMKLENSDNSMKTQAPVPVSKIDDRLEKYIQAVEISSRTPEPVRHPSLDLPTQTAAVTSIKSLWETGEMAQSSMPCRVRIPGQKFKCVATGPGQFKRVAIEDGASEK